MIISAGVSSAVASVGLMCELVARAADVTAITPTEYRDLEADESLWKIDGRFPPDAPLGVVDIDTKNALSAAEFDWHAPPGTNLVTLSYDASQSRMTFSARGAGGSGSVSGQTMPGDTIAWRVLAFGLTDETSAITLSDLTVNGTTFSGEFQASKDRPFNTFMTIAPGGVQSASFLIEWGNGPEFEKFSIQAIGFQSVPEPGEMILFILGSATLVAGRRFRKRS
ncbi:MAG: hypothetical protein QOG91_237 [Candidatus Parcubacteria bacterium]|nr:hypothetical protein [Candidatus Parcubacteria bacterium]